MSVIEKRKYIDIIRETSSKWVNWEPLSPVRLGSYGKIDKETGDLVVEGNIYDPEFQNEIDRQRLGFNMINYPPVEGQVEEDYIVTSREVGHKELDTDSELTKDVPGIANASIRKQWSFKRDKRDAILILHGRRHVYLPPNSVLELLYKVNRLVDKMLVTGIYVCPAYAMYLSDLSGAKVSIALTANAPVADAAGATASPQSGLDWWIDAKSGLVRQACDQTGATPFTPLYSLRRPIKRKRRFFRDAIRPDPAGDELWYNESPPWDPLDEEGEEDLFDPSVRSVDPFKHLEDKLSDEETDVTHDPSPNV